ncbi:divalent-cation tolerance protein CutA [Trichothermofontia sp.]
MTTVQVPQWGLVWVTAPTQEQAQVIAQALVTTQLAACVSITPISSIYTWQGELQQEAEWQLVIKTDLRLFDRLAAEIQAMHSYEVPEIIAIPIVVGAAPYLHWLAANTQAPL